MRFPLRLLIILALVAVPGTSSALTMDFEGLSLPEGTTLTTVTTYPGVSFSGAILVLPGNPRFAFNGNSSGSGPGTIDDANSGATISSPDGQGGIITLTFDLPVGGLCADAVDIEIGSVTEFLEFKVFDAVTGGSLLHTITLTGGDAGTGDGLLTPVLFTGFVGENSIRRLEIRGLNAGTSISGYAVDNICFTEAPTQADAIPWGRIKALYR